MRERMDTTSLKAAAAGVAAPRILPSLAAATTTPGERHSARKADDNANNSS